MLEYAWLIPVLPVIAFLLIVFITRHISPLLSSLTSVAGIGASTCIAIPVLFETIHRHGEVFEKSFTWLAFGAGSTQVNFQVGVLVDPLSASMLAMVTFVATLIQIYSIGYMKGDSSFSRYFAFMSLFCAAMLGLVISNNLLLTFMSWEIVGLCSYLLIGFWNHKQSAADAAKKAFIVTRLGDLGFILGLVVLYLYAGTFNINELSKLPLAETFRGCLIGLPLLIFCGAVGKSAQFPLHVWLPDAMEGPTPVSALIHAATMVAAGVYLVARVFFLFTMSPTALTIVAFTGCITAFIAASIALVQTDIKKILAYSTISQLGYMVMALGTGGAGYTAGMFHLLSHAFFKALLFLGAGSVIHAMEHAGSHDPNNIWKMGGLLKKMPLTVITFIIASLSIAGIPPLSGFWSKDEILLAAKHFDPIIYYVASLTALMTAFYMWRLCFVAFFGKPRTSEAGHLQESPFVMTGPLLILALFAIGFGLINTPLFHNAFSNFVHFGEAGKHGEHFNMSVAATSTILALTGIIIAFIFYMISPMKTVPKVLRPFQSILIAKYYMDELYAGIVHIVMFGTATLASLVDTWVIDFMVNFTGWLVGKIGGGLRVLQTGLVQHYVYVLYGAIVIIVLYLYRIFGG